MIDTKTVPITICKRAKRSQSALTFGSTRMQRYSKSRSSLTVSMGQNVAFNSLKILTGDSSRINPKTVK